MAFKEKTEEGERERAVGGRCGEEVSRQRNSAKDGRVFASVRPKEVRGEVGNKEGRGEEGKRAGVRW